MYGRECPPWWQALQQLCGRSALHTMSLAWWWILTYSWWMLWGPAIVESWYYYYWRWPRIPWDGWTSCELEDCLWTGRCQSWLIPTQDWPTLSTISTWHIQWRAWDVCLGWTVQSPPTIWMTSCPEQAWWSTWLLLGLVVFGSGMKKRIIGINGAHLLQLGIQVGVGDVTTLLHLVGVFSLSGGLALGGIRFPRQVNCFSFWLCK